MTQQFKEYEVGEKVKFKTGDWKGHTGEIVKLDLIHAIVDTDLGVDGFRVRYGDLKRVGE